MADFGEYPPNMARPRDALIVREQAQPDHAVTKYTGEELARPRQGPANPFRDDSAQSSSNKRKSVPAGTAQEILLSEYSFRSKARAVERRGGPEREYATGGQIKEENARIRAAREGKGSATIADGDGAYVGPWARYKRPVAYEEVAGDEELGSDEEYEIIEEEEDEDVVESGTVLAAPAGALAKRKEAAELGEETTTFYGSELVDYQGRTYMHVPQDLDVDLKKEIGSITNYIPKKVVHTWKSPTSKAVTSLRLFPRSGHLLLSGSADNAVRIWDVYHERELLRSFDGHTKAITDLSFNTDGTRFVSGSHDRFMKVWDVETGQVASRYSTGKTPHCLAFSPAAEHAHTFLAGMSDATILCFDTRAGADPVQEYNHHLAAINTVTFVEGGATFLTTSDDKSIRAWNWDVPVPIKYIAESWMFPMTRSALHPSGKSVAYQSSDNQVLVYAATDKFRQNRKKSYRGHNSAGTAVGVDVSPDGQFLASGDTAGGVVFWSWKSCQVYGRLKADPAGGAVTCVLWHPQETSKVVTAGAQGDIKLWD